MVIFQQTSSITKVLPKISKVTTMVPPFNIEACNKLQTQLCLGQSSTPNMTMLPKISKMITMAPSFNIEACNKHQTQICLDQSST